VERLILAFQGFESSRCIVERGRHSSLSSSSIPFCSQFSLNKDGRQKENPRLQKGKGDLDQKKDERSAFGEINHLRRRNQE
jgi:hypothetical protein